MHQDGIGAVDKEQFLALVRFDSVKNLMQDQGIDPSESELLIACGALGIKAAGEGDLAG